MAFEIPLFQQVPDYSARQTRILFDALFNEGIIRPVSFEVSQRAAGANMSVDIAAGMGVVEGDDGVNQGQYLVSSNAVVNVPVSAANPSNPRIDLVVLKVRDSNVVGGNDDVVAVVVAGTPAPSPAPPLLPDSSLLLAEIVVGAGVTTISDPSITDLRTAAPIGSFPSLVVGPAGKLAIARQPFAIEVPVSGDAPGTEDFAPVVFVPTAVGDFTGVTSINSGWFFAGNFYAKTGGQSGDGQGLEHFIGFLAEAAHCSDVHINELVGFEAQASFTGALANTASVGTITSAKILAPVRKDGATGGTAEIAYCLYIDGLDIADLDADEGYSLYIADGGDAFITGSLGVGEGIGMPETATIFFGDCHMTTGPGGNLILSHGLDAVGVSSSSGMNATAYAEFGSGGEVRILWGNGSPEGSVFARPGSLYLDKDGGAGNTMYVKESGNFETGWVAK